MLQTGSLFSKGDFLIGKTVNWEKIKTEFSQGEVPFDRIDINVTYDDDDNRCYTFKAEGEGKQDIIEGLKKC